MKDWLKRRVAFIDGEMPPVPMYNQAGGSVAVGFEVTISAGTNDVYYTLDGSDPRAEGGGIGPSATLYTSSVTINDTTLFRARSRNTTLTRFNWSADHRVSFNVNPTATQGNIAITEVHYHPYPPSMVETNAGYADEDAFEFVELQNISTNLVDLGGLRFTNGIIFAFDEGEILTLQAGATVLIVRNRNAFNLRYTNTLPVSGEYAGGLSNSGNDNLILVDAAYKHVSIISFMKTIHPGRKGPTAMALVYRLLM